MGQIYFGDNPAKWVKFTSALTTIAHWIAAAGIRPAGGTQAAPVLGCAEREELARLRRENRCLEMERDVLAKATAWFAAKSDKTFTPPASS